MRQPKRAPGSRKPVLGPTEQQAVALLERAASKKYGCIVVTNISSRSMVDMTGTGTQLINMMNAIFQKLREVIVPEQQKVLFEEIANAAARVASEIGAPEVEEPDCLEAMEKFARSPNE